MLVRTFTDGELVEERESPDNPRIVNRDTIEERAIAALDANRTYIDRATPTAAQTTAQVKALSQQVNGVIRLLLNQFDGTD